MTIDSKYQKALTCSLDPSGQVSAWVLPRISMRFFYPGTSNEIFIGGVSMSAKMVPYDALNNFVTADPFAMFKKMDRMFNEGLPPQLFPLEEGLNLRNWRPNCDIYETATEIVVKAELPEVKKEDVKVTVDNNVLTIHGERKFEGETKREDYHRIERGYGEFTRCFTLPTTVESTKIKAEFTNGMLRVTMPKLAEAKAKEIKVQ